MTFGGASVGAIVATFIPDLPSWVLPLVISAFGALAYGIHERIIVPRTRRRVEKELIKTEARRSLYFQQYVERSRAALRSLLDDSLAVYKAVYRSHYLPKEYGAEEKRWKVVNDTISGIENKAPFVCKYLTQHYLDEKIRPDLWVICESGRDIEKCPLYKK